MEGVEAVERLNGRDGVQVEGEQFFESNGFVPGEIAQGSLFSVDVVVRRWWSEAAESTAARRTRGAG